MSDIVSDPANITPDWLTEVLRSSGNLPNGSVTNAQWQNIGTGKMGDNARFTLRYDGNYNTPTSVIAKLPAADETARSMAGAMGAYRKEVMFYRELAPLTGMQTPEIYCAEVNADGTEFIILMEDLAPAEPGNQLVGESQQRAELAVIEAAKLHAPFYAKPELLAGDYVTKNNKDGAELGQSLMRQYWPGFVDRFGHGLAPGCIALGDTFAANYAQWAQRYDGAKTLIHGDYRSENILFGGRGTATTVDWQTVQESCALADVAYFLGGSIDTDLRRSTEQDLVEKYRAALQALGVEIPAKDCWQQYREFSLHGVMITVLGAMFTAPEERSDRMFLTMAQRHLQQCVDMHADEFIT
ncbi:MAG: phosphotransferase [Pseudomonadales bacterium]